MSKSINHLRMGINISGTVASVFKVIAAFFILLFCCLADSGWQILALTALVAVANLGIAVFFERLRGYLIACKRRQEFLLTIADRRRNRAA